MASSGSPLPSHTLTPEGEGEIPKGPGDALQSFLGDLFLSPGEGKEHLITAKAHSDVLTPDVRKDCLDKALKDPIPGGMALFVVHLLEAVDIEHGEGDGSAGTLLSLHLPGSHSLGKVLAIQVWKCQP
jgi:hypothetical protein